MSADQWIAVASLATVIVSALAILAGLKSVRDQMRVTVFLEYTERYSKIMKNMPYEARDPTSGYKLAARLTEEHYRVLAIFREYLNFCSEEKWLHDQKRIDNRTWKIWESGMKDVIRFPPFTEAWRLLEPEYRAYGDFNNFVNQAIKSVRKEDQKRLSSVATHSESSQTSSRQP